MTRMGSVDVSYNEIINTQTVVLGGPVGIQGVINALIDRIVIEGQERRHIIISEDYYQSFKWELIGRARPFVRDTDINSYRGLGIIRVEESGILNLF